MYEFQGSVCCGGVCVCVRVRVCVCVGGGVIGNIKLT